jgi:hypothetical protein
MYVHATENDGLLSGWILEDPIDLFLWFRDGTLVRAQITMNEHLLEWRAPDSFQTGDVRTRRTVLARSETIETDRVLQAKRINALQRAVAGSELAPEVRRPAGAQKCGGDRRTVAWAHQGRPQDANHSKSSSSDTSAALTSLPAPLAG